MNERDFKLFWQVAHKGRQELLALAVSLWIRFSAFEADHVKYPLLAKLAIFLDLSSLRVCSFDISATCGSNFD